MKSPAGVRVGVRCFFFSFPVSTEAARFHIQHVRLFQMPLEITRSFVENRDGTFDPYEVPKVEQSDNEHLRKQTPIRPFELKTYLRVGEYQRQNLCSVLEILHSASNHGNSCLCTRIIMGHEFTRCTSGVRCDYAYELRNKTQRKLASGWSQFRGLRSRCSFYGPERTDTIYYRVDSRYSSKITHW